MRFWDREKEIGYLSRYIRSEPNAILFVYGPKSSGKSTLLMKVVEGMRGSYDVYWYDLRERLISSYKDVVDLFFVDEEAAKELYEEEGSVGLGVFGFINVDLRKKRLIEERRIDPFKYISGVLSSSGRRSVIVFDEVQKLKGVYMNSPNNQRELIRELFNFFVRVSKVLHISHVIVMTSDTFFIESIYGESVLRNTSVFYSVDYFDDEVALDILISEGLSEGEASYVVEWCGGVPWMMERVLLEGDVKGVVEGLYKESLSVLKNVLGEVSERYGSKELELMKQVLRKMVLDKKPDMMGKDRRVVKYLVSKEILYYDPIEVSVRFQTKLDKKAASDLLKEM